MQSGPRARARARRSRSPGKPTQPRNKRSKAKRPKGNRGESLRGSFQRLPAGEPAPGTHSNKRSPCCCPPLPASPRPDSGTRLTPQGPDEEAAVLNQLLNELVRPFQLDLMTLQALPEIRAVQVGIAEFQRGQPHGSNSSSGGGRSPPVSDEKANGSGRAAPGHRAVGRRKTSGEAGRGCRPLCLPRETLEPLHRLPRRSLRRRRSSQPLATETARCSRCHPATYCPQGTAGSQSRRRRSVASGSAASSSPQP